MSNSNNNNSNSNVITPAILILSVLFAFLLGVVVGYLVGEARTEDRLSEYALSITTPNQNGGNSSGNNSSDDSQVVQSVDYSKYVINEKLGVTVENFYGDVESKQYASALIGMKVPTITWTASDGTKMSTNDFGNGKYIIEIFSPGCGYCNASIPVVDAYRAKEGSLPIIGLTTDTGDISAFNANGEHSYYWTDINSENQQLFNYIPWIPTFLYIENGVIQLVTYGGLSEGNLENYSDVAFNK